MGSKIVPVLLAFLLCQTAFGSINLPRPELAETPGFVLSHRFMGQLGQSDFLGLDSGANVGIGFDFKLRDNLEVTIQRFSLNQEYQITTKAALTDWAVAVFGAGYRSSAAITNNKTSFIGQILLSRLFLNDNLRVSLIPGIGTATDLNNISASENETAALGLAIEYTNKINAGYLEEIGFLGEYNQALTGYKMTYPGTSVGLKIKTWGHVFTLLVANSFANSLTRVLPGNDTNNLYFGFNLARRFSL